ncbi:putative E3 ubiquitin-protein ligase SINAT1 [Tanacetum coccineum]
MERGMFRYEIAKRERDSRVFKIRSPETDKKRLGNGIGNISNIRETFRGRIGGDVHQLCIHFNGSFLVGSNPSFLESLDQDIDKNNFLMPCFVAFAQHMGLEADVTKMKYSFEIGRAERRITWQGVPCTIRKNPVKVCEQLDAFVVPRKLLLSYIDENHVLQIDARIWLEETKSDEEVSVETIIFRGQDRYFPIKPPDIVVSLQQPSNPDSWKNPYVVSTKMIDEGKIHTKTEDPHEDVGN